MVHLLNCTVIFFIITCHSRKISVLSLRVWRICFPKNAFYSSVRLVFLSVFYFHLHDASWRILRMQFCKIGYFLTTTTFNSIPNWREKKSMRPSFISRYCIFLTWVTSSATAAGASCFPSLLFLPLWVVCLRRRSGEYKHKKSQPPCFPLLSSLVKGDVPSMAAQACRDLQWVGAVSNWRDTVRRGAWLADRPCFDISAFPPHGAQFE